MAELTALSPAAADAGPRPLGGGAGAGSVLAVTSELPWPLNTGGHLRTFHLLCALARRFDVRLVVPIEHDQGAVAVLGANGIRVCPALVPPRARWREALRAVAALASSEPYVLYRRHARRP